MSAHKGLRIAAIFEAAKGVIILGAGLGMLRLLNGDTEQLAERIVRHLQLDPAGRYTRILLEAVEQVTNTQIWFVTLAAVAYSTVRFIEAYGLWKERTWAEWFAVIGGGLYIPVEISVLVHRPNWPKAVLLALNVLVVTYVAWILVKKRRDKKDAAPMA